MYKKYHQYTLSEIITYFLSMSDVLACVSVHCADQTKHSISDFLTKSFNNNTQQTCVDVANEYLQAYNTGADVKNLFFVVCINVNKQVIQCFCLHLFPLTKFFEIKFNIFTNTLGQKKYKGAEAEGSASIREAVLFIISPRGGGS